jgi:hypothetical protein
MNWETRELLNDLQIVKEKIDDVMTSFTWFDEEYFKSFNNSLVSQFIFIPPTRNCFLFAA